MAYDPSLTDWLSRVRSALGDIGNPPYLPDDTYEAVYLASGNSESLTTRAMASKLWMWAAAQPDRLGSGGDSIAWGSRVAAWKAIAEGGTPDAPVGSTQATVVAVAPRRRDGYSA